MCTWPGSVFLCHLSKGAKVIIFSLPAMLTTLALSRIQLILDLLIKDWCQLEEMKATTVSMSTLAFSSIPLMLRADQEVVFAPSAATWEEWRSSAPPSERMRRRLHKKSPITPHLLPREKPHFPSRSGGCSNSTFLAWKSQIYFYTYITKPLNQLEMQKRTKIQSQAFYSPPF